MATNFPGSVDDASTVGDGTHPSADEALSSTTGGPAHHALHQNVGLAINAIEDKVGTGASTPAANTVLTGTGSGTSGWATVSTAMIGDNQVTQAKIADDAVGADQLAASAVVTASIVDDQVTQAKIGPGAVGTTELGSDAVNGDKIANDAVAAEHLATDSVTADAIAANAVDTAEIKNDAVTADKIANNAVGNDQLIASPTFTNITGTLLTNAQTNITSVGTLDDLTVTGVIDANGVVKIINGSESTPALTFDSDEDTGMFRSGSGEIGFSSNGTEIFQVLTNGVYVLGSGGGYNYYAQDPVTGSGTDAEWVGTFFGTYVLARNSSLTAEKENISEDLGTHLTADMIDSVVPKMWNRLHAPGVPEIGPLAEDMDAISPFLAAHSFDEAGDPVLTGINKTGYLSLLVLAVKDLRTQVADLTTRLEAVEG